MFRRRFLSWPRSSTRKECASSLPPNIRVCYGVYEAGSRSALTPQKKLYSCLLPSRSNVAPRIVTHFSPSSCSFFWHKFILVPPSHSHLYLSLRCWSRVQPFHTDTNIGNSSTHSFLLCRRHLHIPSFHQHSSFTPTLNPHSSFAPSLHPISSYTLFSYCHSSFTPSLLSHSSSTSLCWGLVHIRLLHISVPRAKDSKGQEMVRVLNVAEKNDAAKNLAEIMSRGGYSRVS